MRGIVAQVAAWAKGHRNLPGPLPASSPTAVTFPGTPLDVRVYLAFGANPAGDPRGDWAWTDVTAYVYQRDAIVIHRGRADEQAQAEASTCTVTLNNAAGRFVPRNPLGPYYGTFGRNTPLRVDVDAGSGPSTRFVGFVSEWPPRWDLSENDVWVSVTASGVLRRLTQGASPLRSAIVWQVLYERSFGRLAAYWPLEDGANSTVAAPAYGSVSLTPTSVTFSAITGPAGSAPMPDLSTGGRLATAGTLPAAGATQWRVEFLQQVDAVVGTDHYPLSWTTGGTATTWRLRNDSVGTVVLEAYNPAGTELLAGAVTAATSVFTGLWVYVTVSAAQSGSDITLLLVVEDVATGANTLGGGTLAANTVGDIRTVAVNPGGATAAVQGLHSVGQVSIYTASTAIGKRPALTGYNGYTAALRFAGVLTQAGGVSYDNSTVFATSQAMGPQLRAKVVDLLQEVELADAGHLVERLDGRLGFDPHSAWENQPVTLALDYAQAQIRPPFEPTDDDRLLRNDVTVTRTGGTSARVVETTGTLGTAAVGVYDEQATLNLYDDSQPAQHAGWRVARGTIDEYRYTAISFALHVSPTLIPAWLACVEGARVTVSNILGIVSYDGADQLIDGWTERLTPFTWDVALTTTPTRPWHVLVLSSDTGYVDPFLGYLVPDSCALAADVTSGATSLSVTTVGALWSTVADDCTPGIAIRIGGELMTVTAVAGGANPQTLTVTRSVNGVVKAHTAGETLTLADPGVLGL